MLGTLSLLASSIASVGLAAYTRDLGKIETRVRITVEAHVR